MKLNNESLIQEKHKYIRMLEEDISPETRSYCQSKIREIDNIIKSQIEGFKNE